MNSFAQIIDAFGGASSFAKAIGVSDSHARAMKTRDSIPDGYWMRVVEAARDRNVGGITLETFAKLASTRLREKAEAHQ